MPRGKDEKEEIKGGDGCGHGCMVSVSCITFNHEGYIEKAIESFLSQETGFKYEILIHDDASTDATAGIVRKYALKYPDIIKPMYQHENQYSRGISNISGAFNFPRAGGKYIAMCEGDDYWKDNKKLQKQFDFMQAHPDFSMCCHASSITADDNAFRSASSIRPYKGTGEIKPEDIISRRTNIPTASLFFKAEYARELPSWYHNCPIGDVPIHLYMLTRGRIYYFDEEMSVYRIGGASSWSSAMESGTAKEREEKWEGHFKAMELLYNEFDRDTAYKWHEAVCEAINRKRFEIDLKEEKPRAVLDPANRKFLGELPLPDRFLLRLKAGAPGVYGFLRKAYLRARGRQD